MESPQTTDVLDSPGLKKAVEKAAQASNRKQKELVDRVVEPTTDTWEDELKMMINHWITRMIRLGELRLPEKVTGFYVFEMPELAPYIKRLLAQERNKLRIRYNKEEKEMERKFKELESRAYERGLIMAANNPKKALEEYRKVED